MTVNEVSKLTGVSIRTLQYYDKIALLKPSEYTPSGYRLYDDAAIERLGQILLFREMEFSLKEIKKIITAQNFDRNQALCQQIEMLTLKREHIDNLIAFVRRIKNEGENTMDYSVFDTKKLEAYAKEAKAKWGNTDAYGEFEEKAKHRSKDAAAAINSGLMALFADFGRLKNTATPSSAAAQEMVAKLQSYISENYYTCTREILNSLGAMYSAGGDFTKNIDAVGGEGTADFAAKAIASCFRGAIEPFTNFE